MVTGSSSARPLLAPLSVSEIAPFNLHQAFSDAVSLVTATRCIPSSDLTEPARLRRRLSEAVVHSVTLFADFKNFVDKTEALLAKSALREAELLQRISDLEILREKEKTAHDEEISGLRQTIAKLESYLESEKLTSSLKQNARILSLERALSKICELAVSELGSDVESSNVL